MRLIISVLCLGLILSACDQSSSKESVMGPAGSGHSGPVVPHVDVVTLHSQPITVSTKLPGRTVAIRTAEVRPQVNGIIIKRFFVEGSEVKSGQQLYQIDPTTYHAAYEKTFANWNNASSVVKRYKTLATAHAISEQIYNDAVSTEVQAKADFDAAKANLEFTQVKAPISGKIGRSLFTEGALVTNGQSSYLTTITQLDPINIDLSQSSNDLLLLRKAISSGKLKTLNSHQAAVQLVLEDGSIYPYEGKLEFSETTVDENTSSIIMRAAFPNPQKVLLPGMFVHAVLRQGVQEAGIYIPQEAVNIDPKGHPWVYVVNADKTVAQRTIETGVMNNGLWVVTSGLSEGEKIVVAGLMSIVPGMKVVANESNSRVSVNNSLSSSITDPSAQ